MANPTSVAGKNAVFTVDAAGGSFTIDADRAYTFKHDGEASDGTASTDIIYLSLSPGVVADGTEGEDKAKLCSGDVIVIGPAETIVYYACAATQEATMTVLPSPRLDVDGQSAQTGGVRATTSAGEEIVTELGTVNISLDKLDNAIGTHDDTISSQLMVTGTVAEETVPAAVADGDDVQWNADVYGRARSAEFDPATGSAQVSIVAQTKIPPIIETGWAALSTPGDETPARDVRDHKNHTIGYIIANIDTSVGLKILASHDSTNWFETDSWTVLAADPQTDSREIHGYQVTYIKCEFDAEAGGVAATVTFQLSSGN